MGKGADRKRKWARNKRLGGWSWSEIHGKRIRGHRGLGAGVALLNRIPNPLSALTSFSQIIEIKPNQISLKRKKGLKNSEEKEESEEEEMQEREELSEAYDNSGGFLEDELADLYEDKSGNPFALDETPQARLAKIMLKIDHKKKRLTTKRENATKFHRKIYAKYGGVCVITGTKVPDVLDAAHIIPYNGKNTNDPSNGLLLRKDVHKLFDSEKLSLIVISSTSVQVRLAGDCLSDGTYAALHGKKIILNDSITLELLAKRNNRRINE